MVSFTHSLKLFCIRFFNHFCVNGECCQMFGLFLIAVLLLHRCRVCVYDVFLFESCALQKNKHPILLKIDTTARFFSIMKYYKTPSTRSFCTSTKHFFCFSFILSFDNFSLNFSFSCPSHNCAFCFGYLVLCDNCPGEGQRIYNFRLNFPKTIWFVSSFDRCRCNYCWCFCSLSYFLAKSIHFLCMVSD